MHRLRIAALFAAVTLAVGLSLGGTAIAAADVRGATIVTTGSARLLIVGEGCMGSSGLLWFNPRDSAESHVLKQHRGQGVIGWVPYYEVNGWKT